MRVRMTQTRAGSPDGLTVRVYTSGVVYDMPEALASIFLREGWAELPDEKPAEIKPQFPAEPPPVKRRR